MLKPTQVFLEEETLEWASIEAIKLKISRKEFLRRCIESAKTFSESYLHGYSDYIKRNCTTENKTVSFPEPNVQVVRKPTKEESKDITTTEVVLDPSEIVKKYTGYTEKELKKEYPLTPDQSFKRKEDEK